MPKCALKIDLHKVFDSLDWNFLVAALHKLGLPFRFIKWIFVCISTPRSSVKINWSLQGYFRGAKGVRQGCPLSPYLFTIAMNIFSYILDTKPINYKHHWKCKDLGLSHLFFADDVLLFSNGDQASIQHTMDSLEKFSSLSGLQPSITKSSVFFCNCEDNLVS